MVPATAAQTIGPFWHLIEDPAMADLTRFGAAGERITLLGTVRDGDGAACPDACIEIWQSSPAADDRFPGYGRCNTDASGTFCFTTLKPGPVPGRGNAQQAPHIAINILSRGVMSRLYTRAYFAGETLNETDPLLNLVEEVASTVTGKFTERAMKHLACAVACSAWARARSAPGARVTRGRSTTAVNWPAPPASSSSITPSASSS
jgi:protocatechuate 3,4-dioxygenase alpha subunit